jgi:hypothetical protein
VDAKETLVALRTRLGAAAGGWVRVDEERFTIGNADHLAHVSVTSRAAGTMVVVRVDFTTPWGRPFRLTRQSTARGAARAVQELRLGDPEIDDAWAIEADAAAAPALHALSPVLAPLAGFDVAVERTASSASVELRTGTGLATFHEGNLDATSGALLSVWAELSTPPRPPSSEEVARARAQVVTARLAGVEAEVAQVVGLYAGMPQRIGGALEARVCQPLGVEELMAQVRILPLDEEQWSVSLKGAVGAAAARARLSKTPGLLRGGRVRVIGSAPLHGARAVRQLERATQLHATVEPGEFRLSATCARDALSEVLAGALELWRLTRGD